MAILYSALVSLCFITVAFSCDSTSTGERARARPKFHPNYNQLSDIWLGTMEFVDFFCGWPEQYSEDRVRRQVQQEYENLGIDYAGLTPDEVYTLKFAHTLVYFRGVSFEWGASMLVSFNNGTIGRDSALCPNTEWKRQGKSACSLEQAKALAAEFYKRFGEYNLFRNNCHIFSDWFMDHLVHGHCKI